MDSLRRHSLAAIGKVKEKDNKKENRGASPSPASPSRASFNAPPPPKIATTLDVKIESPPAVLYGNVNQSTGALYAGQVILTVVEPEITVSSFTMRVLAVTTPRKPVVRDCPDCASQTTELKSWPFIEKTQKYAKGIHTVPFSYLFPGHLPATTKGDQGKIQYFLDAQAVVVSSQSASKLPSPSTPSGDSIIKFRHEVPIARAVKPLGEKTSIRIFPPTHLTARVTYEPIIHPLGEYNVTMILDGITDRSQKDVQARWRLRKMNWRLEETEKVVSPACSKHAAKVGGEGRGTSHEDTRTVGRAEMKSGWKTDLSEATIQMEFSVRPSITPRPLCDIDSPNGFVVTHSLVIELIIAEEWAPNKTPERATPTGAARVLRMQFATMITERSGMGISWDEEMPPMYEDVPASPPMYPKDIIQTETPEIQRTRSQIIDYTGTPLGPPPPFSEESNSSSGLRGSGIDEVDEEFDGLTLGPSGYSHRRPGSSGAASSRPSTIRTSSSGSGHNEATGSGNHNYRNSAVLTPTSARGRHRLDVEDFLIEQHDREQQEREEREEQARRELGLDDAAEGSSTATSRGTNGQR